MTKQMRHFCERTNVTPINTKQGRRTHKIPKNFKLLYGYIISILGKISLTYTT